MAEKPAQCNGSRKQSRLSCLRLQCQHRTKRGDYYDIKWFWATVRLEKIILRVRSLVTVTLTVALMLTNLLPINASAQNHGVRDLSNRIDRVQRELTTLQQQVYQGKAPSSSESDPISVPRADAPSMARQSIRISQLEGEIRRLTGRIERIDFLLSGIQSRLDKLVADLDQRLAQLEKNNSPVVGSDELSPSSSGSTVFAPPMPSATGAGVLGTIPKNLAVTSPRGPVDVPVGSTSVIPTYELPPGTPKSQYEYAVSLMLKQQNFGRAEKALMAFLEKHPQDDLASNAQYWLGETYYVRKYYQDAAFAFAEGYQKYPKSRKAPDSLVKLGMSLSRMNKREEACTAFSRFLSKYPKATARLKARIDREWRQAKCR